MSRISNSGKLKFVLSVLLLACVLAGIFPGTGGEGAQRETPALDEKRDWWNFATAALYGFWPNGFVPWKFSLTVVQLTIYAVGIWLINRELQIRRNRRVLNFVAIVGGVFVFQLWRDASLLAIETLSLGLLVGVKPGISNRQVIRFLLAFLTSMIGCLFKPIFAPLVIIIFLLVLLSRIESRKLLAVVSILTLVLMILPYGLDKVLSSNFQLKKSYPEQQVLIYDLSKLYCWGYSPEATSSAKTVLSDILANKNNYESICASLSPTGWDSLHVQIPEVESSPALKTIEAEDEGGLTELKSGWVRTILAHPMDWLMTKSSDAVQVLFMANAFHMPGLYEKSESLLTSFGDLVIKIILIPLQIMDKARVFTLAFTFFFGLFMVYRNRAGSNFSKAKENALFKFLAVNFLIAAFATLAFIANNGRYVLPYVLLSYLVLIISLDREKIKFL
jgi:hypothetical protein